MKKASQNKKLMKLMSGMLAILTISSPTSLATKPFKLEDKPGILERLKDFAWPAAMISGAIIITGAVIYGISKIKESRNQEEFKNNLYCILKDIKNKDDIKYTLDKIETMLESRVEKNRINDLKSIFKEFRSKVQNLDDISTAKKDLMQGLNIIVKDFNINFDINEFNHRSSNKVESTVEMQPNVEKESEFTHESNEPKLLKKEFDIFKVAILGSDIENGNTIKFDQINGCNLNEVTVNKLCSYEPASKLSEYEGVTIKDGKIKLQKYKYNRPEDDDNLPENSIYLYDSVFSFYYVNNCEEAKDILPKCQYAICPFIAKLDENLDEHLNRLKNFVKYYQPMCDIRFLYYTNEIENSDRLDDYIQKICSLCVHLYTRNGGKWLQQDIGSKKISKASEKDDYKIFLKHIALECSKERSVEFKDWTGHDVLHASIHH